MTCLRPRPAAARHRTHSLVDVRLDPAQQRAIALPASEPLLVLGEAGHGKTTVLLHRVARHKARRALILVPTEGLVRLMLPELRKMGTDAEVWTFDRFARKQARRAFRRLPRESDLTPPSAMRAKRSPALRPILAAIAQAPRRPIDDDRDSSWSPRADLQHVFGDRRLMERLALPEHVVDDVLERTRVQFMQTTERAWSHVTDRERLIAVDRRAIDEGTSTSAASTIDVEDYAVLFELDRLRSRFDGTAPRAPRQFDLIAIDEAQELAPLELALIGRSLAPGGTLIVSGDADQHTDDSATFLGWDAVMRELGAESHTRVTLEIGYRCAPDIVALARSVRDGGPMPAPTVVSVPAMGQALAKLFEDDETATVGIIFREPLPARQIAEMLRAFVASRVVFDGNFLPRGPVQITIASEVKGLELDYVLVAGDWPDLPATRRALYVALTRARHQALVVTTTQSPSATSKAIR